MVDTKLPHLTPKETVILDLLSTHKEMFGLEIVEASNREVGRGTVYVTLGRLAEKGFVESRQEQQPAGAVGLPRRLYRITSDGRHVLRAYERLAMFLAKGRTT